MPKIRWMGIAGRGHDFGMTSATIEREDGTTFTKHGVELGTIWDAMQAVIDQARVVAAAYTGPLAHTCSADVIFLEKALDRLDEMMKQEPNHA